VQKIVLAAGERATKRGFEMSRKAGEDTVETLRKNGITVTQAGPEVQNALAEVGKTMVEDWRKSASPDEQKVLDNYLAAKAAQAPAKTVAN
jgi:TRAP-type C4-dicarboxylate transport system substrate-binding protein